MASVFRALVDNAFVAALQNIERQFCFMASVFRALVDNAFVAALQNIERQSLHKKALILASSKKDSEPSGSL